TVWFRNEWEAWIAGHAEPPALKQIAGPAGATALAAWHPGLGTYYFYCEGDVPLLFTENSTNHARLHIDCPDTRPYLQDGINDCVVQGRRNAVNPEHVGTKASAHYLLTIGAGRSAAVRLRLAAQTAVETRSPSTANAWPFGSSFDEILATRTYEANDFYHA